MGFNFSFKNSYLNLKTKPISLFHFSEILKKNF